MSDVRGKSIALQRLGKSFDGVQTLHEIDLTIPAGEFTAILGPSGCGKSTTLRLIAGLEAATSGRVEIGGQDVTALPPARRNLSMVFQSYALFPHLSVAENIIFGLRVEKLNRSEREARLAQVADLLQLTPYLERKPNALSGGQQQRVALGRAVISQRPVCLMDEPLSNLDARLRDEMRREIRALQRKLGFTMVYVTHDQTEAITMADQVVLMNKGAIEQVGRPEEIYGRPATPFTAGFIGTPPMNLLPLSAFEGLPLGDDALRVGIRPEALFEHPDGLLKARLISAEFLGADTLLHLEAGQAPLLAKLQGDRRFAPGAILSLSAEPHDLHLFDTTTNTRTTDDALIARLGRVPA